MDHVILGCLYTRVIKYSLQNILTMSKTRMKSNKLVKLASNQAQTIQTRIRGKIIWTEATFFITSQPTRLQRIQTQAARMLNCVPWRNHITPVLR